jgi:hypothetical protein
MKSVGRFGRHYTASPAKNRTIQAVNAKGDHHVARVQYWSANRSLSHATAFTVLSHGASLCTILAQGGRIPLFAGIHASM